MILLAMPAAEALSETVDIYGEGDYSEKTATVSIYADIKSGSIVSYGIKLTYNPNDLTVVRAEKNEAIWYFGQGSTKHAYIDPVTTTPGEVVIVGGKLDPASPTAGVGGEKILLGKVYFNRTSNTIPVLSLSIGKTGAYKNFVTAGEVILDDDSQALRFGAVTLTAGSSDESGGNTGSDSGKDSGSGICFIESLR